MILSIIAALGKNRELGYKNQIPWHLSSDLKRFKALTLGHTVIMGQKTYLSLGHPLPDRQNIVLSHNPGFVAPGCIVSESFERALKMSNNKTEVFIIGGGQTYTSALPNTQKMYLTWVDATPLADVYFPEINFKDWHLISSEKIPADNKNDYPSEFCVYERLKK